YFYLERDTPSGPIVYQPSPVPGPVASVVPPPAPAPGPPPTPAKPTPVAITTPVAPPPAGKPNWCSEDHLKLDELTICATESLWSLDNQLNDVFRKYSDRASDQKAVNDGEAKWVRETRRPCGADEQCITRAYLTRITIFNALLLR